MSQIFDFMLECSNRSICTLQIFTFSDFHRSA